MQVKSSAEILAELQKARQKANKAHTRVSTNAGLCRSAWCLIERRGGNMNTDTLFALAKELGIEISMEQK